MRAGAGVLEDREKVMGTDERGECGEITSQLLSCITIALSWYDLAIPRLGTTSVLHEQRHMESVPEGNLLCSHGETEKSFFIV